MKYTSLQLILRRWYSGVTIPEQEALAELERRGWRKAYRGLVLAALIPFILPERIIVEVDTGDPWEEADLRTVFGSIEFSALMVSPIVLVISGIFAIAKTIDGLTPNWWPVMISGVVFALTSAHYLYIVRRWKRKNHEA